MQRCHARPQIGVNGNITIVAGLSSNYSCMGEAGYAGIVSGAPPLETFIAPQTLAADPQGRGVWFMEGDEPKRIQVLRFPSAFNGYTYDSSHVLPAVLTTANPNAAMLSHRVPLSLLSLSDSDLPWLAPVHSLFVADEAASFGRGAVALWGAYSWGQPPNASTHVFVSVTNAHGSIEV